VQEPETCKSGHRPEGVARARSTFDEVVLSDMTDLPFPSDTFDCIVSGFDSVNYLNYEELA
jgi:hypothetical protein